MKKIISLFKRDYGGNRQVYDEVVPGAEWVISGEGIATIQYDGTCCMVRNGKLYKREDYKPEPEGWEPAEPEPNQHTGYWPGWLPVGDGPEDKWHREAFCLTIENGVTTLEDGTYELVGPKVQGDPYGLKAHHLWRHGEIIYRDQLVTIDKAPRDFNGLCQWLKGNPVEGIVWHHPDGRMVKIKRRDFGISWPILEIV